MCKICKDGKWSIGASGICTGRELEGFGKKGGLSKMELVKAVEPF